MRWVREFAEQQVLDDGDKADGGMSVTREDLLFDLGV